MRIRMNFRWLAFFLIISTCFLLISEAKGVGGRRGGFSRSASIVDYYPHQEESAVTHSDQVERDITHPPPHQEEGAITHPHQVEGLITHPPHQVEGAITHYPLQQEERAISHPDQVEGDITHPPPHQEKGDITHPHQVEGTITYPPPHKEEGTIANPQHHQEEEVIRTDIQAEMTGQRRSSPQNAMKPFPRAIPPLYSGERISAANYPRLSGRSYGKLVRIRGALYRKIPGYFCLIPIESVGSNYPKRIYPENTLISKLRQPQSDIRAPDNMDFRRLLTETNMPSKPEKKKRSGNNKKNRKNKTKRNRNRRYRMESVTNTTEVSTLSSEETTQETATITLEVFQETTQRNSYLKP